MSKSCYGISKLVYFQDIDYISSSKTSPAIKNKNDNIRMVLSEFKNILEFRIIPENKDIYNINSTLFISSNDLESINVLNSIISTPEDTLICSSSVYLDNNNKFKQLLLNNQTINNIINSFNNNHNDNNYNNNSVYIKDIQLFFIQNSTDLNWYFYSKNNLPNDYTLNQPIITSTLILCNKINKVFINHQAGSILINNNQDNNNWDYIFKPNSLSNTFYELKDYYYIVNKSLNKSLLEMLELIRNHLYQGTFEIHVSVQQSNLLHYNNINQPQQQQQQQQNQESFINLFKEFCNKRKLKSILIELSKGVYGKQMMTSSHHSGDLYTVQLKAFQIAFELLSNGYQVSRIKIEILASCKGVPENDTMHKLLSTSNYFEFHIKLLIPNNNDGSGSSSIQGNNDFKLLKELMVKHDGHLSKNSFKVHVEDSYQERFITLRMYSIGKDTAMNRFESCKNDLELNNFNIASSHREYSIYDSNINLDSGWIE